MNVLGSEKMNIIGQKIKKERISAGLSQKTLIEKMKPFGCKMNTSTLSKIEQMKRGVNDIEIYQFSKALEIEINEFFED